MNLMNTLWLAGKLLLKRVPYILITSLCLYGIAYLIQFSFYRFAPPSVFLSVSSAKMETTQVNQPINLTLCRNARQSYRNSETTRSFYMLEGSTKVQAGTYTVKTANYEKGDICQIIRIPVERHPTESGIYDSNTEIRFEVKFDDYTFPKTISYNVDETFRLSDTVQGLQTQILDLKQQIEILNEALRSRGVDVPEIVSRSTTVQTQSSTGTVSIQPNTNPPATNPVPTAPPDPQPTNQNQDGYVAMLIDGVLRDVDNLTTGLVPNGIL